MGFPFDDEREEDTAAFRSQLDDIAARHPELAHHFGSFPFRSGSRSRNQIPEEFTQRFTDRPFPEHFGGFEFPFDETEEVNTPYYQRYPQYYPQDLPENQNESSSSCEDQRPANSEVHVEETEQEEPGRGRKLKNIQQSNTVDLGRRQEQVDDRNQRSMSAPPINRQRFVSSINIPINQPSTGSNMPQNVHQPSAQPQERVIPIHVEGRDEPIMPKIIPTSTNQPDHPHQPQPPTDKFFTQKSPNFSQYFNRDPNSQSNWFPKTFQTKQPQAQTSFGQNQRGRSPQPKQETPADHSTGAAEKLSETQKQQISTKPDPIDQIKSIQKDVSALMTEVENFDGQPKDKKYLYLDEMLTRNLIKLDNIDTQGQVNIRSARKEAIKCIEKCISVLESKALSNVEVKSVENCAAQEGEPAEQNTSDATMSNTNIPDKIEKVEDQTMEVVAEEKSASENQHGETPIKDNSGLKHENSVSELSKEPVEAEQSQELNAQELQDETNLETKKPPPANTEVKNQD